MKQGIVFKSWCRRRLSLNSWFTAQLSKICNKIWQKCYGNTDILEAGELHKNKASCIKGDLLGSQPEICDLGLDTLLNWKNNQTPFKIAKNFPQFSNISNNEVGKKLLQSQGVKIPYFKTCTVLYSGQGTQVVLRSWAISNVLTTYFR